MVYGSRHFGLYQPGYVLRDTQYKGRNSAVKSSQLSWTGQYKMGVQYDFKFTPVYSGLLGYSELMTRAGLVKCN